MKWLAVLLVSFITGTGVCQTAAYTAGLLTVHRDSLQKTTLVSLKGKKTHLSLEARPLTAFVFISPECPLCRNYTKTLNELSHEFSDSLTLIGIVPGKAYSLKEISSFSREFNLSFHLFEDPAFRFSSLLQATVTPEVVLLSREGVIRYRGAIDDWVVSLGQTKTKASIHYLENAINQSLENQPVIINKTNPVGCLINDL